MDSIEQFAVSILRARVILGLVMMYAPSDQAMRIFISHPYRADPAANQQRVRALARHLAMEGHLPIAPQIYLPAFIDEAIERDLALRLCLTLVALSDEVRIYGSLTEGMRLEIAEARRLGIPVVDGETGMPYNGEPPR